MIGPGRDPRQVAGELFGDNLRTRLEQDRFDPVLVRAAPDVAPLAVERALQLHRRRRDVVGEEKLLLERDPDPLDVDAGGLSIPAQQDAAELSALQLLVARQAQKVVAGGGHVPVPQAAQDEFGASALGF